MHTSQLNLETIRQRSAEAPHPAVEHLSRRRADHPPPPGRRRPVRRTFALALARAARRLDREAARRAAA